MFECNFTRGNNIGSHYVLTYKFIFSKTHILADWVNSENVSLLG